MCRGDKIEKPKLAEQNNEEDDKEKYREKEIARSSVKTRGFTIFFNKP